MADLRVPDLNKVIIAGRLTRDPELKYVSSGRAVCHVSIANSQHFKGKDGERRESTTFVDVTLWDKQAEWVGERLKKGRPVLVEGRLKSDSWDDKTTGQKRSKLEISGQRLTPLDWDDDGRGGGGGGGGYGGDRPAQAQQAPPAPRHIEEPIPEDDIPF